MTWIESEGNVRVEPPTEEVPRKVPTDGISEVGDRPRPRDHPGVLTGLEMGKPVVNEPRHSRTTVGGVTYVSHKLLSAHVRVV